MLVVSQVAVSLVLLVGAGLVLRSYSAARHADGGFNSQNVTALAIDLQTAATTTARGLELDQPLARCGANRAGVRERHASRSNVPLSLVDNASRAVTIEGYAPRCRRRSARSSSTSWRRDYFRTLQIPLLAGRDFTRTDDTNATPAVIVNETLARRFWQTPENAIGKRSKRHRRLALRRSAWRAT